MWFKNDLHKKKNNLLDNLRITLQLFIISMNFYKCDKKY